MKVIPTPGVMPEGPAAPSPRGKAVPRQDPTYLSPCLPPLLGFTNTRSGCVPG